LTSFLIPETPINPNPVLKSNEEEEEGVYDLSEWESRVFDLIRSIKDPEYSYSLEQLKVIKEKHIHVDATHPRHSISIQFTPTVPHCSLAAIIGLCIRQRLNLDYGLKFRLLMSVEPNTHDHWESITKQINDKERIFAAMENVGIQELVASCLIASSLSN